MSVNSSWRSTVTVREKLCAADIKLVAVSLRPYYALKALLLPLSAQRTTTPSCWPPLTFQSVGGLRRPPKRSGSGQRKEFSPFKVVSKSLTGTASFLPLMTSTYKLTRWHHHTSPLVGILFLQEHPPSTPTINPGSPRSLNKSLTKKSALQWIKKKVKGAMKTAKLEYNIIVDKKFITGTHRSAWHGLKRSLCEPCCH